MSVFQNLSRVLICSLTFITAICASQLSTHDEDLYGGKQSHQIFETMRFDAVVQTRRLLTQMKTDGVTQQNVNNLIQFLGDLRRAIAIASQTPDASDFGTPRLEGLATDTTPQQYPTLYNSAFETLETLWGGELRENELPRTISQDTFNVTLRAIPYSIVDAYRIDESITGPAEFNLSWIEEDKIEDSLGNPCDEVVLSMTYNGWFFWYKTPKIKCILIEAKVFFKHGDGDDLQLSSFYIPSYTYVEVDKPGGLIQYDRKEGFLLVAHSPYPSIEFGKTYIQQHLMDLLNLWEPSSLAFSNEEKALDHMAHMEWMWFQLSLMQRGSAACGEILTEALCGRSLPSKRDQIAIATFCPNQYKEKFQDWYRNAGL